MKKRILVFLIMALFIAAFVSAEGLMLEASLTEGETRTYTVEGREFMISLIIVSDSGESAKFNIDGVISQEMVVDDTLFFDDSLYLRLDDIRYDRVIYEAYIADFSIFSETILCGDGICNAEESCVSCLSDCGECDYGICGDGICSADYGEYCEADNCCAGHEVDFTDDYFHCGSCRNRCKGYEKCMNSQCVGTCGNGYCEAGEDQTTCPQDCGSSPECSVDSDCDDSDACTSDLCSMAGECFNILTEICPHEEETIENDASDAPPVENASIVTGEKIEERVVVPAVEKKETFVQRIIGWIMRFF